MRNETKTRKFLEKVGQIIWPAFLLISAIIILLLAISAGVPHIDIPIKD